MVLQGMFCEDSSLGDVGPSRRLLGLRCDVRNSCLRSESLKRSCFGLSSGNPECSVLKASQTFVVVVLDASPPKAYCRLTLASASTLSRPVVKTLVSAKELR